MATNTDDARVEVNLDTDDAEEELKRLQEKLNDLRRQTQDVAGGVTDAAGSSSRRAGEFIFSSPWEADNFKRSLHRGASASAKNRFGKDAGVPIEQFASKFKKGGVNLAAQVGDAGGGGFVGSTVNTGSQIKDLWTNRAKLFSTTAGRLGAIGIGIAAADKFIEDAAPALGSFVEGIGEGMGGAGGLALQGIGETMQMIADPLSDMSTAFKSNLVSGKRALFSTAQLAKARARLGDQYSVNEMGGAMNVFYQFEMGQQVLKKEVEKDQMKDMALKMGKMLGSGAFGGNAGSR